MSEKVLNNLVDKMHKFSLKELESFDLGSEGVSGKYSCLYNLESSEKYDPERHSLESDMDTCDIYIHIPFCSRKCDFCVYSVTEGIKNKDNLIEGILDEMEFYNDKDFSVTYLSVGGGSPSLLPLEDLEKIIEKAKDVFNTSNSSNIKIELHPELVRKTDYNDYLKNLREIGFNQVSVGVESFNNQILNNNNRGHSVEEAIELVNTCKQVFETVRIDILYGLEDQSINNWRKTIKKSLKLNIDYVCAYKVIKSSENVDSLRKKDLMQLMVLNTFLKAGGWYPEGHKDTEIRFRKIGENEEIKESNGRLKIIGLGPSSFSITDSYTALNSENITDYLENVSSNGVGVNLVNEFSFTDELIHCILHNTMFNSFIDYTFFEKKFGIDFKKRFSKELSLLKGKGLLELYDKKAVVTKKGLLRTNFLIKTFLPQDYLKKYKDFRENGGFNEAYLNQQIINHPFGIQLDEENI